MYSARCPQRRPSVTSHCSAQFQAARLPKGCLSRPVQAQTHQTASAALRHITPCHATLLSRSRCGIVSNQPCPFIGRLTVPVASSHADAKYKPVPRLGGNVKHGTNRPCQHACMHKRPCLSLSQTHGLADQCPAIAASGVRHTDNRCSSIQAPDCMYFK